METSRRGFLKACGLVAGSAIILPSLRLIVPDQTMLPNELWLATVRETFSFDIYKNCWFMRMDVLAGKEQFGVDCIVGSEFPTLDDLSRIREPAIHVLSDYLRHEGIAFDELRPPPIPVGYVTPEWARAA